MKMLFLFPIILVGCTENERVRHFGGTMKIELPCNQKLINITWKEDSLWHATRTMRSDEQPETYSFREDSGAGLLEGEVKISERACL